MTFSRGLSTGWFAGTNHPYLTHGKFGKKRGPLLGTITECGPGWIRLGELTGVPFTAGDGVVFDAGENRDLEQGARIWVIEGDRLIFHLTYSGINFDRIKPGQTLYKTSDPKLDSELRRFWQNSRPAEKKTPLHLVVSGKTGEPITVAAVCDRLSSSASSTLLLEPAAKHPLGTEKLVEQLGRLGDSSFELGTLDNQLEGNCHIAVSALNQLRRALVKQLETAAAIKPVLPKITTTYQDLLPSTSDVGSSTFDVPTLSVLCRTPGQVAAALECGVETIYCDFEDPRRYKQAVALVRSGNSQIHLATPRILKPGETGYLKLIEKAEPDGLLLRNLGALHYYKDRHDLNKIGDFSLNVANPITAKLLMENAALDYLTVSYDLNIGQVLELLHSAPPEWFELTLHQHMPMFHMEHCVFCVFLSSGTTYKDCGRPCETHVVHLRDRVGQLHRLQADVGCRNTLFNGKAQTGARYYEHLRATGLSRFRVELLDEAEDAAKTIRAYQDLLSGKSDAFELLNQVQALEKLGVTEGTLAEH
jgi:putative protease